MKKLTFIIVIVFLMALFAACGEKGNDDGDGLDIVVETPVNGNGDDANALNPQDDPSDEPEDDLLAEGVNYTLWPEGTSLTDSEQYVMDLAVNTLVLLKNKDWGALGAMVHPDQGLTFSPYGFVDESTAVHLGVGDVKALDYDTDVRMWGYLEGPGDPIECTFAEYYDRFIFDRDFTKEPQAAVDRIIKTTMENNLFVFGNGGSYVEFHKATDDPGMEDFDWSSLRFVFSWYQEGQDLYLAAIVHDEWTP